MSEKTHLVMQMNETQINVLEKVSLFLITGSERTGKWGYRNHTFLVWFLDDKPLENEMNVVKKDTTEIFWTIIFLCEFISGIPALI